MKKIKLSGKRGIGKYIILDDDDFLIYNDRKWFLTIGGYAAFTLHMGKRPNRKEKTMFLHRLINSTPDGLFTDHINRNKLDNRKCNLRTVTNTQNQLNKGLQKNNKSGIEGVTWHVPNKKWWVRINIHNKQISLGCYNCLDDALTARRNAEKLYL